MPPRILASAYRWLYVFPLASVGFSAPSTRSAAPPGRVPERWYADVPTTTEDGRRPPICRRRIRPRTHDDDHGPRPGGDRGRRGDHARRRGERRQSAAHRTVLDPGTDAIGNTHGSAHR